MRSFTAAVLLATLASTQHMFPADADKDNEYVPFVGEGEQHVEGPLHNPFTNLIREEENRHSNKYADESQVT